MLIYLADLGHNLLTLSSDVYPLGIANLATYAKAYARQGTSLEFRLFREPQDLKVALDQRQPDLLGLSNYAWNQQLAAEFARYVKTRHSATLTIMGGPNWPLTEPEQASFLHSLPDVDAYIDGPTYEGERAFLNLVNRFSEASGQIRGTFESPIPGVSWFNHKTGEYTKATEVARIEDLDEIPSPYLAGLLDPYFSTGYFPMMQIARGCPFSCAFCNSGVTSNSRINAHSIENVRQDLEYIAERVNKAVNLCFADDNFGMYQRDEEIADFIAWLQEKHGWPMYIRTTTGKNNTQRILRVMRKIRGALPMTAAVQSMNPVVLENIKRSNIKLETYTVIQKELEEQGLQSYGELILCLPGETRETFMKAVSDLLDAGAKRISAHQLMLLHGAELANPESRQKFGFNTRFRIVARNIGTYTDRPIIEVEEMVVATPTFTFQDYLDCRIFHLLLTIFYYEGNYEEVFRVASARGIKPFDALRRLAERISRAPEGFTRLLNEFVRESNEELFMSARECLDYGVRHYDELVRGDLGGNLLSKYSLSARFYHTAEGLEFLRSSLADDLAPHGPDAVNEMEAAVAYLDAVLLRAPFRESMARETQFSSTYDVPLWVGEGFKNRLAAYQSTEPRTWHLGVEQRTKDLITTKVNTFGEHPQGLGKFTRTMFARDLRRIVQTPYVDSHSSNTEE